MKECAVITFTFLLALEVIGLPTVPPGWNHDYDVALQRANAAKKPLAVFIGTGKDGWKAVSAEGELGPDVHRLLADEYVCLYVDAGKAAHKELAQSFEAGKSPLLVLSSRNRAYQAYRHEGAQANANLALALKRHATEEPAPVANVVYQAPCRT
jgi:hypothetical protein